MNNPTWICWRDATHATAPHPIFGWPSCQVCGAAPPYHERSDYLPEGLVLNIYVPRVIRAWIAPRSAIVGLPSNGGVSVHYEGWIRGPAQYADRDTQGLWEAGVEHAGGRMVTDYPTVAQGLLPASDLTEVGCYYPRTRAVVVTDELALNKWLAEVN